MKASKLVWNLVVVFITVFGLIFVHGKRQKPRHEEIERVINETHSVIWKCSTTECHPGSGLNVQCGTSIPISIPIKCVQCVKGTNYSSTQDYSNCKSCRNCGKHENKRGECTLEEDTTVCLGTCHKGFYMDKITRDCHPCSECCSTLGNKHYEKQCEDSGLPQKQWCRQTNIKCPHPTNADQERQDQQQGSHQNWKIAAIVVFTLIFFIIIGFLVILKCYGWAQVKSTIKKWCCCCCCQLVQTARGNTVNFHVVSDQDDLESAFCNVSGSHLTEDGDMLGTLASGLSDAMVLTTKTSKRPIFQRMFSVPVKTQTNFKSKIPRSFSHPGALKELEKPQETSDFKSSLKKLFYSPATKKRTKNGYTRVETEPEIDDLLAENRDSVLKLTTSGELLKDSPQSGDFVVQEPGKESTAPVQTELAEIEDLPAANLTSSEAVSGNSLQPAGSMVEDPGKERLEKPSAKDQCTSTTELHLPSTTQGADIPQEFLNRLLRKKTSAIPIKFYSKICTKLDTIRQLFWDDYRLLAEKVSLDKDAMLWLGQRENPTELILQKFDSQRNSSIGQFKAILEEMERNDVVTIIEEWVLDEWNNNS